MEPIPALAGMMWVQRDPAWRWDYLTLQLEGWEVALVNERAGEGLWNSTVNRHLRDWRRRPYFTTPSRALALRCAERYTVAHLARIRTELPEMRPWPCGASIWYPPTNPNPAAANWRD